MLANYKPRTTGQQGFAHILLLILLVAGIVLGIYLVQNRTNIFPHAASGPIAPRTAFSFQGNTNSVQVGQQFDIDVVVSSDFDAANTFNAKVVYKHEILELVSISPGINDATSSGSFIKKWIEQVDNPNLSDSNYREVSLSGAVPNPGFKTEPGSPGVMAKLRFRAKAVGQSNLGYNFNESAIYRNSDNQNILSATDGWSITVNPSGSSTPARPGKLSLKPNIQAVGQGCTLSVDIEADTGGRNSDGTDVILKYDPTKLTINSYTKGNIYPEYIQGANNVSGAFALSGISSVTKSFNGKGIFATVNFKFNPNFGVGSNTEVMFDFNPANSGNTTDSNIVETTTGQELLGSVVNGSYAVTSSSISCVSPSSTPSASPTPSPIDPKRADLYKDTQKPNFVNDQDISVFFSKCAEKGVELFGQPASVQPVCDINNDGTINAPDWAILIKYRNKQV